MYIQKIIEKYNPEAAFNYGSFLYKNKKPSDYDFIIVTDKDYFQESFELEGVKFEVTNYKKEQFLDLLKKHEIAILECIFIDSDKHMSAEIKNYFDNFKIEKEQLRESLSSKSSNSYVKAKKKLIIEEDFDLNVSLKSLWHSFRILKFGIDIAKNGNINPESCNNLYEQIKMDYIVFGNDWDKIHKKYKPLYNDLASEFKLICPKKNKIILQ